MSRKIKNVTKFIVITAIALVIAGASVALPAISAVNEGVLICSDLDEQYIFKT